MKVRRREAYFILPILILFLFSPLQARIYLWKIGSMDGMFEEFIDPTKRIIDYHVPADWSVLLQQSDPNWGEFPYALYTFCDTDNRSQEIRINFNYLENYRNPTLTIMSTIISSDPDISYSLEIYKGDNTLFIGSRYIDFHPSFYLYSFPVGYIKKGFHEENQLVLKGKGTEGAFVLFDTLYLSIDDKDSDGDGVSDADEGSAGLNQAIASIPLDSYIPNPLFQNRIILQVDGLEGFNPYFREVGFLDPNIAPLPSRLLINQYAPYVPLAFKIDGLGTYEQIPLFLGTTDPFYPSVRFYMCQDTNVWHEIDFEIIDGNQVMLFLTDGSYGDSDGEKNGNIAAVMTFTYPYGLDIQIEKQSCFIGAISPENKYEILF